MESATPPRGLDEAIARERANRLDRSAAAGPTPKTIVDPSKNPTTSTFQLTLYRSDHKRAGRYDVAFRIADTHNAERRAELRAEAHAALDRLLDASLPA